MSITIESDKLPAKHRFDAIRRLVNGFVTPDSNHRPASIRQALISVAVARDVALDFRPPPLGVIFRPGAMLRTSMPEAPIEENGDALSRKHNIDRASCPLEDLSMNSEPQPAPVQLRPKRSLGRIVALRCMSHSPGRDGGDRV